MPVIIIGKIIAVFFASVSISCADPVQSVENSLSMLQIENAFLAGECSIVKQENQIEIVRCGISFWEDGREIDFVKIDGMTQKDIQSSLNNTMEDDLIAYFKDYLYETEYFNTYGLAYEMIGEKYLCLSLEYRVGQDFWKNHYLAVYDLTTGKKVLLSDLFDLSDEFVKKIQEGGMDYAYDSGESIIYYPGYVNDSEQEIRDKLLHIAMSQEDWNANFPENKSYDKPNYIITNKDLYLSVPIPLDELEQFLKVQKWW